MLEDERNASRNNGLSFGNLLSVLNEDNRKLVRKLEKLNKKFINNEYGILFNKTCITEKLFPKYTNI